MAPKFKTLRFHVTTGPDSLFQRAGFKLKKPRSLSLGATHVKDRRLPEYLRQAFENFNSAEWELMQVEVRSDTGKFVKVAYRRFFKTDCWWVVVGFKNTIVTYYQTKHSKSGMNRGIVTLGNFYDFVESVNRLKMDTETVGDLIGNTSS